MNRRFSQQSWILRSALALALVVIASLPAVSQWNNNNWGLVVSPVYNTSESGTYAGAELFAGPNKFGSYFAGVAPNGRKLTPAALSVQTGMNPLGATLTPDGKYLITSNDDEREGGYPSYQNSANVGGYSLNVIDASSMSVVSQITTGSFFVGVQVTGTGPYTVWASGGPSNSILLFTVQTNGTITASGSIPVLPILPSTAGYVSDYTPDPYFNTTQSNGFKPPVPTGFTRTGSTKITFPAGSALSPDGKYLYVACNGDNSVAVIDTAAKSVVKQVPVGYFPYAVSVSSDGTKVLVSNWGIEEYKFLNPTYGQNGKLTSISYGSEPVGYFVPVSANSPINPKASSVSVLSAPSAVGANLKLLGAVYQGHPLDSQWLVGDTHPSATGIVKTGGTEVLYVARTNSDTIGIFKVANSSVSATFDLSLFPQNNTAKHPIHGSQPNAIVVSPDGTRVYVAEAGINSVAVLDSSAPLSPRLLGRIPTGWYPTGLSLSADGKSLYITNAKGVGEDINPNTNTSTGNPPPTGVVSTPVTDSNYIFGSVQKVDLTTWQLDNTTVLANNYQVLRNADASVVPIGGAPSSKIKHVIFILHENKTFDSMLGNLGGHFGNFSGLTFNNPNGSPYTNGQYTGVSLNLQTLAKTFAAGVNYYSDSEESDAGHQFAASGMASDYTEKTLLVKSGRGLLVNKNFEPEDYPETGYIFNNAARNNISFKDYGALVRIDSTDTGTSTPTTINDPNSGLDGAPKLQSDNFNITNPLQNLGDVSTPIKSNSQSTLGQSYFMNQPILAILGQNNANGEPHLDHSYPGYNFNISDQRRAAEFMADFDRMVANGTLPEYLYIYQPNDHTGGRQASNDGQVFGSASNVQQVADGDVGLGMVVQHIMRSSIYYDANSNTGTAIFITFDDAQSTLDHIHPHRTPVVVVSPFAKPGYYSTRHYNTASVVKTEELLMGMQPNNLGDLFATDLRDFFQPTYNGITPTNLTFNTKVKYEPTPEGIKIWSLVSQLDTSAPDRDSHRLGALGRLSIAADDLHNEAAKQNRLDMAEYKKQQESLYETAVKVVTTAAPRDDDGDGD